MSDPRWLSITAILAIHSDQIREHGGSPGLRDTGLLASALDRPPNRLHYEPDSDLAALAAAYGFGIAKNHPFVDGNERVAFQAMYVFLGLNGITINAEEQEVVHLVLRLAAGELTKANLPAGYGTTQQIATDRPFAPSNAMPVCCAPMHARD